MKCPSCAAEVSRTSALCPSCGVPLVDPSVPTYEADRPAPRSTRPASSSSIDGARFAPGAMLTERYRIVGLLGRGGMGEVYRAEDLTLGQAVALKFLPAELSADAAALARFHREVRSARQVSHPNVCRVFDIGDVDGQHFLSMEYIDGEDLATLLRRIGRLPSDKAVEIARQICAGLAAAHEAGVLHRDLKPANVMIDGRGRARIVDFGLAGLEVEFRGDEVRGGTPVYMAPEQLAGREVSVRSDIFSLGLVLYELFTGRRAFEARSHAELVRLHEQSAPTPPTEVVKDLDPAIERAILRCLERDPKKRPRSALAVAAALPGGDPLAEALAAGETPSPEMVAAAGEHEGLQPRVAWSWLGSFLAALLAAAVLLPMRRVDRYAPMPRSAEVLAERARQVLVELGYTAPVADREYGFRHPGPSVIRYVETNDTASDRWERHGRRLLSFWYRSSPQPLEPRALFGPAPLVTTDDPPWTVPGMAGIHLDTEGHLVRLRVVPAQSDERAAPAVPDWGKLFRLAGLDLSAWTPAAPSRLPPDFADSRAAWEGRDPVAPHWPMRIEAAAYRGLPTYFEMTGPWTPVGPQEATTTRRGERVAQRMLVSLLVILLLGGVLLARRNLRMGRGDRRGAARLAGAGFALSAAVWLFGSHHVATLWQVAIVVAGLSWAIFAAAFLWVLYLALEPYARRRWPASLISWSCLLAGQARHPVLGRDILVGVTAGMAIATLFAAATLLPSWTGRPPLSPTYFELTVLDGGRHALATISDVTSGSILLGLGALFLLLLLRVVLRRGWLAALVATVVLASPAILQSPAPMLTAPLSLAAWALLVFMLTRYGLVAACATVLAGNLVVSFPITLDFSAWYAGIAWFGGGLALALALFGFWTALAGRPLFSLASLEE